MVSISIPFYPLQRTTSSTHLDTSEHFGQNVLLEQVVEVPLVSVFTGRDLVDKLFPFLSSDADLRNPSESVIDRHEHEDGPAHRFPLDKVLEGLYPLPLGPEVSLPLHHRLPVLLRLTFQL